MVKVIVSPVGRPPAVARALPITVNLPGQTVETATVGDVKKAVAAQFPKFYSARQKLSLRGDRKALADDDTLEKASVADGTELNVKDLGPQISWRTVFIVEYAGPLVIHPIFYYLPKLIYGGNVQHSTLQQYAFSMVMAHFLKREFETIFIHYFSKDTMPARNIFKNSAHYHILGGLFMAFDLYRPKYATFSPYIVGTKRDDPTFLWVCTAVFAFAELSNLKTHLTLSSLRAGGSRKRAIPYGYGFDLVSVPNYFFECLAWLTVSYMTGSPASWLFFIVGTGQMILWAAKKHRNYKMEFGTQYPKNRKIMIPFIY